MDFDMYCRDRLNSQKPKYKSFENLTTDLIEEILQSSCEEYGFSKDDVSRKFKGFLRRQKGISQGAKDLKDMWAIIDLCIIKVLCCWLAHPLLLVAKGQGISCDLMAVLTRWNSGVNVRLICSLKVTRR